MPTPDLFAPDAIDFAALAALAARSVSRLDLQATHRPVCKSTDLLAHGYSVLHWVRPGVPGSEVLEFNPCKPGDPRHVHGLPRFTVEDYRDQAAAHVALGLRVVGPGRRFSR